VVTSNDEGAWLTRHAPPSSEPVGSYCRADGWTPVQPTTGVPYLERVADDRELRRGQDPQERTEQGKAYGAAQHWNDLSPMHE
jgi:hypothetical protein